MKIIIEAQDFEITSDLEYFVSARSKKLLRLPLTIAKIEIQLFESKVQHITRKTCKTCLFTSSNKYFSEAHEKSYEMAIALAIDDLDRKMQNVRTAK